MAGPLIGERRIASSHLLLAVPSAALALACVLSPVFGTSSQWGWLNRSERVELLLLDLLLFGMSGLMARLAFATGIFMSEEGLRVQRVLRSEAIRWEEIGKVSPGINGNWALLQRGQWGDLTLDAGSREHPRRVFLPSGALAISGAFSSTGLRQVARELLDRVPPSVWASDPESQQWLRTQADGTGPLLTRLI